jgi:hypothetical protein
MAATAPPRSSCLPNGWPAWRGTSALSSGLCTAERPSGRARWPTSSDFFTIDRVTFAARDERHRWRIDGERTLGGIVQSSVQRKNNWRPQRET